MSPSFISLGFSFAVASIDAYVGRGEVWRASAQRARPVLAGHNPSRRRTCGAVLPRRRLGERCVPRALAGSLDTLQRGMAAVPCVTLRSRTTCSSMRTVYQAVRDALQQHHAMLHAVVSVCGMPCMQWYTSTCANCCSQPGRQLHASLHMPGCLAIMHAWLLWPDKPEMPYHEHVHTINLNNCLPCCDVSSLPIPGGIEGCLCCTVGTTTASCGGGACRTARHTEL